MVIDDSSTRVARYECLPYELNAAPALHFASLIADPVGSCLPFLLYSISHPQPIQVSRPKKGFKFRSSQASPFQPRYFQATRLISHGEYGSRVDEHHSASEKGATYLFSWWVAVHLLMYDSYRLRYTPCSTDFFEKTSRDVHPARPSGACRLHNP
jgi:hypothetical protein